MATIKYQQIARKERNTKPNCPSLLSQEDQSAIQSFYRRTNKRLSGLDSQEFTNLLMGRMCIEYWLNFGDGEYLSGDDFFNRFIQDETHYAMERSGMKRGFKWDDSTHRFSSEEDMSNLYGKKREQVLKAACRRGLELFTDWKSTEPKSVDDKRNLACSLVKYLR